MHMIQLRATGLRTAPHVSWLQGKGVEGGGEEGWGGGLGGAAKRAPDCLSKGIKAWLHEDHGQVQATPHDCSHKLW